MTDSTDHNRALVATAFERWREGEGDVFDLLADDVIWTIVGARWPAGVYRGRAHYLSAAVTPLFAKLAEATVPRDIGIIAQGAEVVVRWRQDTPLKAGGTYRNDYAWFLMIEGDRIRQVAAFLDLDAFVRVVGNPQPPRETA